MNRGYKYYDINTTRYNRAAGGPYQVILKAASNNGCNSSATKEITIFDSPTANFFAEDVCLGEETKFINTSAIQNGSLTYYWNFDNSTNSNLKSPSIDYLNAGQYNVKLEVVSEHECKDTIEKFVIVNPNPELNLGGNIATCGETLVVDALNPGADYLWSDNTTNRTIILQSSGSYYVIVTNEFGCSVKENFSVELSGDISPDLGNDTTVCGKITLDAFNPQSSYHWSTGEKTPSIEITESGNYAVTVTDQNNCEGIDNIRLTIHPLPSVNLGNDIHACENEQQRLQPITGAGIFLWSDNSNQSFLNVNNSGTYWVKATSEFNCSAYDTIAVVITALPDYQLNDITFCGSGTLDAGNSGSTYLWSDGSNEQALTVTKSGNYWVKIAASKMCSIVDSVNVTINEVPVTTLPDYVEICDGDSVLLDAANLNSSYSWSSGQTGSSIFVSEAGLYSVDVTNNYNCSLTKFVTVEKNKRPDINLGSNQILCTNDTLILNAGNEGVSYEWYFNNELQGTQKELNVYKPGIYRVIVTNSKLCTNSDSVRIEQTEFDLKANFIVASDIYAGDTIQFVNLSEPDADSYLWSFGDGTSSNLENPQHRYYISDNFHVGLNIQKGYCTDAISKIINVKRRLKSGQDTQNLLDENLFEIKEFKVFPNPNRGQFRCKISLSEPEDVYVYLFNINGTLVYRDILYEFDHYEIDYNFNLKSGMYILSILSRGIMKNRKIIIVQ